MDLSDTVQPTSDQLDAIDLSLSGPRTFTITKVEKNNGDQPVNIHLAEFPRVWRPGKSMRRVLIYAWGPDASAYVGRRVELFCDPSVKFGGEAVGGTRIRALSHIAKALTIPLLAARGKSAMFRVAPLPDAPPAAELSPVEKLRAEWQGATPERRKEIEAEVAALTAEPAPAAEDIDVDPTLDADWVGESGGAA